MTKHKSSHGPIAGEVGYRTRNGMTGLDPIDTQKEYAFARGVFIRKLLTGTLRTRNPIYLVVMAAIAAILLLLPLIGILTNIGNSALSTQQRNQMLTSLLCFWPIGALFLLNVIVSLRTRHR